MIRFAILLLSVAAFAQQPRALYSAGANGVLLPDPSVTPGALDRRVRQSNIRTTICVAGYTKKVRKRISWTTRVRIFRTYGVDPATHAQSEIDHVVPLELGGMDSLPNLWPQPYPAAHDKDRLENYLHRAVCSGKMTLAAAQSAISANWYMAYKKYVKGASE